MLKTQKLITIIIIILKCNYIEIKINGKPRCCGGLEDLCRVCLGNSSKLRFFWNKHHTDKR